MVAPRGFITVRNRFEAIGFTVEVAAKDNTGQLWRYKARRGSIIEYYADAATMLSALKKWEKVIPKNDN